MGLGLTLGFMVYAGRPESALWFLGAVPFAAWCALPFAAYGAASRWARSSFPASVATLLASVLLVAATGLLLTSAFVTNTDAQSGLVFVFLPLWQLLALLPFLAVAAWLRARSRSG